MNGFAPRVIAVCVVCAAACGFGEPNSPRRVSEAMSAAARPMYPVNEPPRQTAAVSESPPDALAPLTPPSTTTAPVRVDAPLSMDEVLDSVDARFPLLLAVEEELNIAEGGLLSAEGGFDLTARAELLDKPQGYYRYDTFNSVFEQPTPLWGTTFYSGYRWGQGDFPSYDDDLRTDRGGEVRAGVKVPILQGGPIDARRAKLQRARIDVDLAEPKIQLKRIAFRRKAAQLYWKWVGAGQKLSIARSLLDLAETRNSALRRRVDSGDLPRLELIDNERLIELRRAIVIAAERGFQESTILLSLFLRDESGDPVLPDAARLPPVFPEAASPHLGSLQDAIDMALAWRPETRELSLLAERTRVDFREAENKLLPKVDMLLEASKDFDRAPETMDRTPAELAWKVQFEMPLWLRDARGKVRSTRAKLSKIAAELRYARDQVAADVRNAVSELVTSHDRLVRTRESLRYAREVEAGERKSFELGNSTILLVNLREEATATTAALEADAATAFFQAEAAYRAATAADLWDSSHAPLPPISAPDRPPNVAGASTPN